MPLQLDNTRTLLVVSSRTQLSAALREELDPAYVLVQAIGPRDLLTIPAGQFPWAVVTDTALPGHLQAVTYRYPVLPFTYRRQADDDLPAHAVECETFADLAETVQSCLRHGVAGMQLAVETGVEMPDGRHARSAPLQALVSFHPRCWAMPSSAFAGAKATLRAHGVDWAPITRNHLVHFDSTKELRHAS